MTPQRINRALVSKRALVQRINRALAREGEKLITTRGGRWRDEVGDYYAVDLNRNSIIAKHVDLEDYGRELKVLKPWEKLEVEE